MSALGRWTSTDPLADDFPAWGPYVYSYSNPIGFMDPTGMAPEECCVISLGVNVRVNTIIGSFSLEGGFATGYSLDNGSFSAGVYSTQGTGPALGAGGLGTVNARVYPLSDDVEDLDGGGIQAGAYVASGTGGGFKGNSSDDGILSGDIASNPSIGFDLGIGLGIATYTELTQTQVLVLGRTEGSKQSSSRLQTDPEEHNNPDENEQKINDTSINQAMDDVVEYYNGPRNEQPPWTRDDE